MHSIKLLPRLYYTIAMDFIVTLPIVEAIGLFYLYNYLEFNTLLIVTCKFSKKILLILGNTKYSAKD